MGAFEEDVPKNETQLLRVGGPLFHGALNGARDTSVFLQHTEPVSRMRAATHRARRQQEKEALAAFPIGGGDEPPDSNAGNKETTLACTLCYILHPLDKAPVPGELRLANLGRSRRSVPEAPERDRGASSPMSWSQVAALKCSAIVLEIVCVRQEMPVTHFDRGASDPGCMKPGSVMVERRLGFNTDVKNA
ncbi:unnamed protein product [Pleuronectes platessa]|uniref:Uncharacterized protein n=1 Tax=Pleuronectes platessa TaxID=8262 RepID=A0A9N7V0U0_PLEPL|nr:unnamed protein product [Pleuronectes platessa]